VLLVLVGGPWWLWRLLLYMRKKANTPMDLELLLYGLLAAVDVLSATLVLVLLVVRGAAGCGAAGRQGAGLGLFLQACCCLGGGGGVESVVPPQLHRLGRCC